MVPEDLERLARDVLNACRDAGVRLAVAESCTGGLISGCLTAVAGSSDVVERGFVTYSNEAKMDLLGVPEDLLMDYGAVSAEVARAMAEGALSGSRAQLSAAVTGIAGPGGGTAEKPVGLVHMATARAGGATFAVKRVFGGEREAVRLQAVETVLTLLMKRLR